MLKQRGRITALILTMKKNRRLKLNQILRNRVQAKTFGQMQKKLGPKHRFLKTFQVTLTMSPIENIRPRLNSQTNPEQVRPGHPDVWSLNRSQNRKRGMSLRKWTVVDQLSVRTRGNILHFKIFSLFEQFILNCTLRLKESTFIVIRH